MVEGVLRYSEAFKLQVVGELESGRLSSVEEARRRYGIGGKMTVQNWVRQYGRNDLLGRVVRVDTGDERDRVTELEQRVRDLERALADSKVEETLAKAYFEIVCEEFGVSDVAALKKNIAAKRSGAGSSSGVGKRG